MLGTHWRVYTCTAADALQCLEIQYCILDMLSLHAGVATACDTRPVQDNADAWDTLESLYIQS